MQRVANSLPGVYGPRPLIHRDSRGSFLESYHHAKFADLDIKDTFLQDNHSISSRGTLRGLHYQLNHPQAKLCRVVEGEALDVVADIRVGSPHFGKWTSVRLSAKSKIKSMFPLDSRTVFSRWPKPFSFFTNAVITVTHPTNTAFFGTIPRSHQLGWHHARAFSKRRQQSKAS